MRITAFAIILTASVAAHAQLDNPVAGLTPEELEYFNEGKALFQHEFTVAEGRGPLYNAHSCATCHFQGGVGGGEEGTAHNVFHFGIEDNERFFDGFEFGGPVRQQHSLAEEHDPDMGMCMLQPDVIPVGFVPELIVAHRHTPPVFGFGLIDALPDDEIRQYEGRQVFKNQSVLGVANWGTELEGTEPLQAFSLIQPRIQPTGIPRVGRFGWHAPVATLFQFSTEPFNIELGVSTPFFPRENHPQGFAPLPPECRFDTQPNDANSQKSELLYLFQAFTAPPPRGPQTAAVHAGEETFKQVGCTDCHREKHHTAADYFAMWPDGSAHRVAALSDQDFSPWSDFLTHDMGPLLDDHRYQGRVDGAFWRTTPLWGIRFRTEYLHDGSATSIDDAIAAHGGEGSASRDAYFALSPKKQADLDAFLDSL
jgi:CxxC motif-containing protein (DUF1111 family)